MELFKLLGTIAVDNAKAKAAIDETTTKSQAMASKLSTFFGQIGSTYQKMFEGGKGKEAVKSFDEVSSATEKQRAKLDELKAEYKNLYMQQGKNSNETKNVAKEIEKLSKEINKNEEDLEEASKAADKYDKSIKDVGETAEKTESKLSKTFGAIGKGAAVAGKAIAAGLVAGTTAMAGLTVKALQLSGDLGQNMGGAEAVFGELGKTIADMETPMQRYDAATGKVITETSNLEKVSKEAYKNMGLSQSYYLATANKMGALFKGAGFETQEALDLSSSAMQRAADVASILGIDTSAAMEAVAGAAKGNFTMMDNLGVAMNDTAIGAYALEKGISKSTSEMTQQEKIGLAMEMFMEKTAYAAGNYAKENETLAGSLGTAKSALTNFLAGSGDVDSLVSSFSNLANVVVNSLKEIAPRLTQGISDLVTQVAPMIAPLLQTLLPVLVEGATTLINGLVAALPGVISALLDALPMLIDGIMSIVDALIGALPQIVEAIVGALPTLIPQLIDAFVSLVMMLVEMLPQIIDPLIAALPTIIISIVEALVNNLPVLIEGFIQLFMGIVTALPQIIQALVDALPTVISLLVQALLNNLPAIITGLIQCVGGIVTAIPQIFGALISAVPAALSGIWDGIKNVFGGLGEWFGEKFKGAKDAAIKAWDGAKEKWNSIKEKCVEGFSNFKDKVGTKFSEAKESAQQKWADAKQKWSNIKDKVVDGFSDLKNKLKTKFTEAKTNAQNVWNDAKSKFSSIKDKVVGAFGDLGSKLKNTFNTAKNNATQTWSTVKGAFEKIKNGDIVGAFGDLGTLMKGKFTTALNTAKKAFDKVKDIGLNIVKGIGNGITSGLGWIKEKITSFCGNVTSFIKKLFKIKSPSQLMRDEVGRELARGVGVGIEENTDEATVAMKKLGDEVIKQAEANLAGEKKAAEKMNGEILKLAKEKLDTYKSHNDMTAAAEAEFWNKIRNHVSAGSSEASKAEKNYHRARGEMQAEALETAKKRLEVHKVYNETSAAMEAAYWDEIRKSFKQGSDEQLEADKLFFDARNNIAKEAMDKYQSILNKKIIYNRGVTVKEEKEHWKAVLEDPDIKKGTPEYDQAYDNYMTAKENEAEAYIDDQLEKLERKAFYNGLDSEDILKEKANIKQYVYDNFADDDDAKYIIDKEVASAVNDYISDEKARISELANAAQQREDYMKQQIADKLSGYKEALETEKVYQKVSAKQEAEYWDYLRTEFEEGTKERIEADKLYFAAKDNINKEILDSAKNRLEDYKQYNTLTLAEEMGFWDELKLQFEEGTDERIECDKNYLAAKKEIDSKILSAEEALQDKLDGIAQRVPDRQKEILDKFGLFDKFDAEDDQFDPATQMLLNMEADIKTMEKYNDLMEGLEERIGGTALYDELKSMGIDARGNILEVSKMTDAELAEFVRLYDEKAALARNMAQEDLTPQIMEDSQAAFDEFVTSCGDLGVEITATLTDYMATAKDTVFSSLEAITKAFSSFKIGESVDVASLFETPTLENGATVYKLKTSTVGNDGTDGKDTTADALNGVQESVDDQKGMLEKLIDMLDVLLPELKEAFNVNLYLDGRQLAAELAPNMDAEFGLLTAYKERGR